MKRPNMIIVGKRIRQARVLAGLTQEQLAEKIGISRTAIVRWEAAETEPTLEHLMALTELLHVSADYLLGLDSNNNNQVMDILIDMKTKISQIIKTIQKDKEEKNQ